MAYHKPVLVKETVEHLKVKKDGKYIDCTLGDGGHTIEILKMGGIVLGFDVDQKSLDRATKRIEDEGFIDRFTPVLSNFKYIDTKAKEFGFEKVDGIIFDLGYSSTQLDIDDIGLTFQKDQDLDMRLDKTLGVTASDLVNAIPAEALTKLIREYSDEKFAKKIANAIVSARKLKKIQTTSELVQIIKSATPLGYENNRINPATRTFQALRIAVNDELTNLEIALPRAAQSLLPGKRMGIISFHSLEDRLVKTFGRSAQPTITEVFKKPIEASENEVRENPRARSAKLRIFEKI